ncbi:hypothetical protein MKZ38_004339 [Zalerion maritima]|uniref:Uncharacterized protein n=1 Tax=Zalerion maritima TaxID=339359 RepID=A0AAD5RSS5_9PEZI|nr:hypothetical protein MKZ38_004339 [Zalerion maritima]
MPPFRNPFTRRPGATTVTEENARPDGLQPRNSHPGFERVDTVGSKASSALSVQSGRSLRSIDTGDYKLSVVNDSGVYLPPSPTDEKGLWPRQFTGSRVSTDTKSSLGDIEHFGISRESFDSYRRSFDITARSPVVYEPPARASLDSARLPRYPRSALDGHRRAFKVSHAPTPEEFEDVGLEEKAPAVQPPRKRGFFSKFSNVTTPSTEQNAPEGSTTASMTRWIAGGRKRAVSNSGQGSELKPMDTSDIAITTTEGEREEEPQALKEAQA